MDVSVVVVVVVVVFIVVFMLLIAVLLLLLLLRLLLHAVISYPPFHKVGLLIHETDFLYNDTKQVVRERQAIELSTAGMYQKQRLQFSLNMTEVDAEDPPQYIMEWGGRETGPLSLLEIGKVCTTCT